MAGSWCPPSGVCWRSTTTRAHQRSPRVGVDGREGGDRADGHHRDGRRCQAPAVQGLRRGAAPARWGRAWGQPRARRQHFAAQVAHSLRARGGITNAVTRAGDRLLEQGHQRVRRLRRRGAHLPQQGASCAWAPLAVVVALRQLRAAPKAVVLGIASPARLHASPSSLEHASPAADRSDWRRRQRHGGGHLPYQVGHA